MGNRFAQLHNAVAERPASIDAQIKCVTSELERYGAHRDNKIRRGEWHPHTGAEHLHQLRSVLLTLQGIKRQQQAYINREEARA